jgi:Sulfotransferase domain
MKSIMLPNFLMIGTAKSGTTTLMRQLCRHPNVGFASAREPNFFAFDGIYSKGLTYYESLFSHCAYKKAVGEKSWRYSVGGVYPKARDRIAEHLPDVRLVYIVRHPLARAESLWIECLSSGQEQVIPDFNHVVRTNLSFVDSSIYWTQLNRYRDYFSDDRILVLFYEDLAARQREVVESVLSFIGVEPGLAGGFEEARENLSAGKRGDNALLAAARRLPGFARLRDAAPPIARGGLRRLLKRELHRPAWNRDTRQWFLDRVDEDCRRILAYAGKEADYWRYEQP